MSGPKSPADFPMMQGVVRIFLSDGGDIALEVPTESGSVHFRVDPGQIGMIIRKLFEAAREAQRRRGEDPSLKNIINDIQPMVAVSNPTIRVANTLGNSGRGMVGIIQEIGGVPFAGTLTPEQAHDLAAQLQTAVHDQAAHSQWKPS